MQDDLHTKEVMEILGVSRRTVQTWVKSGKLAVKKDAQGRNIFTSTDIESMRRTMQEPCEVASTWSDPAVISFTFNPVKQVIIDVERYEGLLTRLAQLEVERRSLQEKVLQLEDKRPPWWRRLFRS